MADFVFQSIKQHVAPNVAWELKLWTSVTPIHKKIVHVVFCMYTNFLKKWNDSSSHVEAIY